MLAQISSETPGTPLTLIPYPLQVDPLAPRPQPSALLEQYQKLLVQEEECQQAIRDIEWEVSEIIRTRTNQARTLDVWVEVPSIILTHCNNSVFSTDLKALCSFWCFKNPLSLPFVAFQEQNITLEMPYYDIVRIKAEQSDEEEDEEEQEAYDYLSPFLPALSGMQQLTREQVWGEAGGGEE